MLGDYLTLLFLFDQEIALVSHESGNNPTHRSIGHSSSARFINKEDVNVVRPPTVSTPILSNSLVFKGIKQ